MTKRTSKPKAKQVSNGTAEGQRILGDFVGREVYYCVSSLIHEMAQKPDYMDDLMPVLVVYDYETPASEHIAGMQREEAVEYLEALGIECRDDESNEVLRDAVEANAKEEGLEAFCVERGIEPHTNEVYEHWIVSDWLAGKLEAHGEAVLRDFYGLTIWGRTTTGQAIALDGVIQTIYNEAHSWGESKHAVTFARERTCFI